MDFDLLNAVSNLEPPDGVIALPTTGGYWLAGRPTHPQAVARAARLVKKVFPAAQAPAASQAWEEGPLLLGWEPAALSAFASDWPATAQALIQRYWPGDLILQLPVPAGFPAFLAVDGLVRVQQPADPRILDLLAMTPGGVLAARRMEDVAGQPVTQAKTVYDQWGEDVDFVLRDTRPCLSPCSPTEVRVPPQGAIRLLWQGGLVLD